MGKKAKTKGQAPQGQEQSAMKGYDAYWGGFPLQGTVGYNNDISPSQAGVATIYSTLSGAYSAISTWVDFLSGLKWVLKDRNTEEVIFDSKSLNTLDENIPRVARAIIEYSAKYRHNLFGDVAFSDRM